MIDKTVGVGPHPKPWPKGIQYDTELLASGDKHNVIDKYRYLTVEAVKADLDKTRNRLEIAIENWQHDFNMGTIVRNANAFNVKAVHVIGNKHWNKRGAMVTDVYMNIYYHETVEAFVKSVADKHIIAIDNQPGAQDLHDIELPKDCVLVFGGEGPGLSPEMVAEAEKMVQIEQFGSTRSVNVGVASGIAIYAWVQQHVLGGKY
jgi:tRNA G18 (ribose-2'-O)-methylase SpoU